MWSWPKEHLSVMKIFSGQRPDELFSEEKTELTEVYEGDEWPALKNLGRLLFRSLRIEWGT